MKALRPHLSLIRPRQWVKNVLVFAPAFFAGVLFVPNTFSAALLAFAAFSCAASAVYIFNDYVDREADAKHPKKRRRPLASGTISTAAALALTIALIVAVGAILWYLPALTPVILCYLILNVAYSCFLKRVPVIDISLVSFFYVLRVVAGGVAVGVMLSPWIVLATFFLALFLVAGKRHGEATHVDKRAALAGYASGTLTALLIGSAVLAIASYGLWTILTHTGLGAVYSVVPVTAIVFRTLNHMFLYPEEGEAPEALLMRDGWSIALGVLWMVQMWLLIY